MANTYKADLAHIHDTGFGDLANNAAHEVIQELKQLGFEQGTVTELGCGSGISSKLFVDSGFQVVGFDVANSFVKLARDRVPQGKFHVGSFLTAELPDSIAVTAFGEVFNYTFDRGNNKQTRFDLFKRVYSALTQGGLFVFDMASPERVNIETLGNSYTKTDDWTVLVESRFDKDNAVLTREIVTFRKIGEYFRREDEIHDLALVNPKEIIDQLESIGFSVATVDRYGSLKLPKGLVGYIARKL